MGYSSGEYPLLQEKQQECELCVASAFSSINMKSGTTAPWNTLRYGSRTSALMCNVYSCVYLSLHLAGKLICCGAKDISLRHNKNGDTFFSVMSHDSSPIVFIKFVESSSRQNEEIAIISLA